MDSTLKGRVADDCVPSSKAKATIQWEYQAMPDRTVWLFAIPRIAKELISHQDPAAELFFASTFAAAACSAGKAIAWLVPSHFKIDKQSNSCLRTAVTPTTQLLQALLAVVSCARH